MLDGLIEELGAHTVERTDRLSADISHNNRKIEKLKEQIMKTAIFVAVIAFLAAAAPIIVCLAMEAWR